MKESDYIDLFLKNNGRSIERIATWKRLRWMLMLNRKAKKLYSEYLNETDPVKKNELSAQALNSIDNMLINRARRRCSILKEDVRLFFTQFGKKTSIDHSDRRVKDYYSVVVITKNSAPYIREFILFYQATGADRIYLYDNDSTDNLAEMIKPFTESGFVVYRRWPGKIVQSAAYRDAVRRSKRRTKWLAIVDDDEFLFSPKGPMPEQLRDYEDYPGVGVNWVMYGPNGHDKSPAGLVMDNYTTTFEDGDCIGNHHIKSIVQPRKVSMIHHAHFAGYKRGQYAVDEKKETIDNYSAVLERTGRAFTPKNYRDIFRINHYCTKSLEDLRRKCLRGFPDGSPNADYDNMVDAFNAPMVEDVAIAPYADIVRERLSQLESCEKTR
ncbi:MAG: glycosyltransferase family 92 protein [Lachnospiraceae bacterium]|nr:glycosyltransferase family 92 protein [Lachnospiraceae bacterium]